MSADIVWIKCDGCSREYQNDARWVRVGVGSDPPLAHHAMTGEPMTCPWCCHVGVRVVPCVTPSASPVRLDDAAAGETR